MAQFSISAIERIALEDDLGFTVERANVLLAWAGGAVAVSIFLVGPFIDWLGIRRSLQLAFGALFARDLLVLGATLLPGMPGREVLIPVAWVASGPFLAMIPVTYFVAQKRYSSRRARATGYYVGAIALNLGAFVAPFLVVGSFHDDATRLTRLVVCTLLPGLCLLLVSLLLRSEEQLHGPGENPESVTPVPRRGPLRTIRAVLTTSAFWKILTLNAALTTTRCTFLALSLFIPKYLSRTVGPDTESFPAVMINVVIVVVGLIVLLPFVHRWRTYPSICYGALVASASMLLLALPIAGGAVYPTVILWVIVLSVGELVYAPRVSEYMATVAPVGSEGTYYSLSHAPWPAVKMFAAMTAGFLLSRWIPEPPPEAPLMLRDTMEAGELGYWDSPSALWLILAGFAVTGPVLLIVLRRWFTAGTWFAWPPGEER